jgi:hypothetical protein
MTRVYSNAKVDRAGRALSEGASTAKNNNEDASDDAYTVLSSWRALHAYPLSAVATTLRNRAVLIDPKAIVAQRLKRFPSIKQKLQDRERMALTQMQDIAGCRVVVGTVEDVYQLKSKYVQYADAWPDKGPELISKSTKDYVFTPKEDGYRSIHLVLKYRTTNAAAALYNGLRVEVQIRSRLQHAWAMAVETASSLTNQALKAGRGRAEWRRFFRFMGSAIALKENLPLVPYTPDEVVLFQEIRTLASELRVIPLFEGMSHVVSTLKKGNIVQESHPEDLYLLQLNAEERTIAYSPFSKNDFSEAVAAYASVEREYADNPNVHIVLVSVGSIANLHAAYPSYFLDTAQFVEFIKDSCDRGSHIRVRARNIEDLFSGE